MNKDSLSNIIEVPHSQGDCIKKQITITVDGIKKQKAFYGISRNKN